MAVEFVAGAQSSGSTVAIPAHLPGDLILAWSFRSGSNFSPVIPSGPEWQPPIFQSDGTSANNSAGAVLTWKIADTDAETFGTFSNATQCEVAVYRGAAANPIGVIATATASSTDVIYPAVAGEAGSLIVAVAAHRTSTVVNTPPLGMVNRVNRGSGTAALAIHDANNAASSFAGHTVAGTIRSSYRSIVFELKAAAAAKRFLVGAIPLSEKYVGADRSSRYVGSSPEWMA